MDNHIESLIEHWLKHRDKCQWLLATVIETQGSAYRKAGAMMLINELGQYFGLISGGCLESDVMRQAKKSLASGQNKVITYDMQDDNDISWQLGIGCGGMVKILLQPIDKSNNYLMLNELHKRLVNGDSVDYLINIHAIKPQNDIAKLGSPIDDNWQVFSLKPRVRLAIFGGGADAIPLANIAKTLGWHVTVVDSRPSYARQTNFHQANRIINKPFNEITSELLPQVDIAIIMTHNVKLDAQALNVVQHLDCQYSGLLGPKHRTERVLDTASLTLNALKKPLFTPVGFDIGGDLPESIALSMLSQAHAFVYNKLGIEQAVNAAFLTRYQNAV